MKNSIRQFVLLFMLVLAVNFALPGTLHAAENGAIFAHEAASLVIAGQEQDAAIFWLRIVPNTAGVEQLLAVRHSAGLEAGRFAEVASIVCRADVLPDSFVISEQIYFDAAGQVIADWVRTDWTGAEQPGEMIAGQAQAFLPGYFTIKQDNFPGGFCGIPWGSAPDAVAGAIHDETLADVLRIYSADVDVTSLLGNVRQVKKAWLVFAAEQGLQRGVISFDGREYEEVLQHLTGLFGNPRGKKHSILYWQLADNLQLELDVMQAFGMLHGTLHVSNPQFEPVERQLFGIKQDK